MQTSYSSLQRYAVIIVRVGVSIILFTHGMGRLLSGRVAPFGEFISSWGLPLGIVWAWGVTLIEIIGTPLLAFGRLVLPLSIAYIIVLATGIATVHIKAGWYVVGSGRNGIEFSTLLIICLLAIILSHWKGELWNSGVQREEGFFWK